MGVRIRQKTKGKGNPWWIFIVHNGRRTSRKVGDKAAAEKVASEIRARLQLGGFNFDEEKPIPTFKEYADSWVRVTVPATCKASTTRDYQDILRIHVLPVFGNMRVTEIKRGKVKDFLLDKTNKGYAASTVTHIKNVISGVLNKAMDDEVIHSNPTYRLGKIIKTKDRRETVNPLTEHELKNLLDAVQENFSNDYPLFLLLARTGLRIGEALALQWGDVDFNGRFIHVQRGVSRGRIELPKNGKTRKVDMSKQLIEALKIHRIESKKKGLALGLGDAPEYMFTGKSGGLIDKDVWRRRVFNKVLEKAGLRKVRVHDIRHTYSTLRIGRGHSIEDVSNQLGHHSVKLTWDVYYHWLPGKKKAEVDTLDDLEYQVQSGSVRANKK